jgi:hypothetical protein
VDVLTFKSYTAIFLESIYLLELKKQNPKTRQVVFDNCVMEFDNLLMR